MSSQNARTEGIHHAGLTVPDLAAARASLESALGLALKVADTNALGELNIELSKRPDVTIEFEPEVLGGGPSQHMMLAIPGGIRLEIIAPVQS